MQMVTRLGLGGAEAVALSLVRGLRPEFNFAVFAIRGIEPGEIGHAMQQELAELEVPLFCGPNVPLRYGGMLFAAIPAGQAIRAFKPGVVHLHTEIPESAYAAMVALQPRTAGSGIVRTIHNSNCWQFWPGLGAWCERRLRAARVACVSRDAEAAFAGHRQRSGAGPLPAAPVIIPNGIRAPGIAARRTRNPDSPLRLLFAGRFEAEKGCDLLPHVIPRLHPPRAGAELVLHGHGTHRRQLATFAASAPSGWTVRVRPPIADLGSKMAAFDLVVVPSRLEGLPLVAIEAMLSGVPVVGTDAPGLREVLPPNHRWRAKAGDAASFTEALQRALDEPETWAAAAAEAQAFARDRFDYQKMLDAYATLYRSQDKL